MLEVSEIVGRKMSDEEYKKALDRERYLKVDKLQCWHCHNRKIDNFYLILDLDYEPGGNYEDSSYYYDSKTTYSKIEVHICEGCYKKYLLEIKEKVDSALKQIG